MKNHKIEEKEYLDCFLQTAIGKSWHGKHNIVKIEETENFTEKLLNGNGMEMPIPFGYSCTYC